MARSINFYLREWHTQYYSATLTEEDAQAFIDEFQDDDYSEESLKIIHSLTPEDVLNIATKAKPDIELKFKHLDYSTSVYDLFVYYCRQYVWNTDVMDDDECTDSDYDFTEIEDEN